jgi:hypothetical protein
MKIKTVNFVSNILILFKTLRFLILQNDAIYHIKMAIRHMWRVANGLDNAALACTSKNRLRKMFFPNDDVKNERAKFCFCNTNRSRLDYIT